MFDYNLKDDEVFFFGLKLDNDDELVIGTGTDDNHCYILLTTKKMLKFLDDNIDNFPSIFHIDSTYKITKNGFPLLIFGRSDIKRQFYKIAFMMTSHEQEIDFIYFYENGSDAMRNAAITVFGEKVKILMCYFHIEYNVITKYVSKKLITRDKIKEVFNDIDKMHESSSDSEFNCFAKKALAKWRRNNLKSFADHFEKEWIESPISNWKIYQTPPGYSSSNIIIESHNRTVKVSFTLKKRLSFLKTLELLQEKCIYICHLDLKLNNEPIFRFSNLENLNIRFTKEFKQISSMVFLSFVALTDTASLFVWNLNHYIQPNFNTRIEFLSDFSCKFSIFLQYFSLQATGNLLSIMCVDRFITIMSKPGSIYSRLPFLTVKSSYIWSLLILTILFLLNSHILIFNGNFKPVKNRVNITTSELVNGSLISRIETQVNYDACYWYNPDFRLYPLWDNVNLGVYIFFPFGVMLIFNMLLKTKTLMQNSSVKSTKNKEQIKAMIRKRRLTFSILVITFAFITMTTPGTVMTGFFFFYFYNLPSGSVPAPEQKKWCGEIPLFTL
ncbi:unnamed protein product [Brachionus calyciflorus]|uniref:G-protein coupled receptors family 1 profile domain-containing protein n=1 Tax=Brachionus calyciflorus TaxID=104777 RepID=A0A813ZDA7_9BILA|nr:unnamed protein product [Brachionus calyciflorus]